MRSMNRWVIATAGVFLQIALGAVYAWSVFRIPLAKQFGWSIPEVTLTFTISIFVLGVSAFFGGLWLNRRGPRIVALTGGVLYGVGVSLASFSSYGLWWLYLSYGVIGGIGLGFAYIVPVAVLVKWFPDHRGLITGIAVGGFGAGALITAPVATRLIQTVGVLHTFAYLGIAFLIVTVISGSFMQNPPEGWRPEGWNPTASQVSHRAHRDYTLGEALATWQWWALWLLLFLNTSAGISVISQEAPLFQELARVSAVVAAGMVGVVSLGNALGRVFWAWASDAITRKATFFVMFLVQAPAGDYFREHTYSGRINHFALLRRRIRDHACIRGRLFRRQKRWPDLRPHVDRLGFCKCVRAAPDCLSAPGGWHVPWCAAHYCRRDAGFRRASGAGVSAARSPSRFQSADAGFKVLQECRSGKSSARALNAC